MSEPRRVSELDLARLQLLAERERRLEVEITLLRERLARDRLALFTRLRAEYELDEEDEIDIATGAIRCAPRP